LKSFGSIIEDYLRQKGFPKWPPDHPALMRFKARRCASLQDFRLWVADEIQRDSIVRVSPCPSVYAANGALSLLNLCTHLLDRQLQSQAVAFEAEGGFTERLYRRRTERRKKRDKD
jgi:four helix bundle suffix protein